MAKKSETRNTTTEKSRSENKKATKESTAKKDWIISTAENNFFAHFNTNKTWAKALLILLRNQKQVHRRDIEALDARKYFMRDQISRLITLGIVRVHANNQKGQPIVLNSNLFKEEKTE